MIWHSILLMTVLDLLIVAAVGYVFMVFLRRARRLWRSTASRGLMTMAAGLGLIALIYVADLLVMHVGPLLLPQARAMAWMRDLHLNYQWPIVLFGVVLLAVGFSRSSRQVLGLLERVEAQDQNLKQESSVREQTEHKLSTNEERFRDFAEATSDWFWEQDANLRFTMVSPGIYEKAGLPAEDHVGKTRYEVSGPGASAEAWAAHEADLAARRPFRDFVVQRRCPNEENAILSLSLSGKPVFDAEGRFKGYRGVGRNITEQERAAATLRASESRFQAFLDGSPDAVSLKDQDGRYLLCNREFERFVGLGRDEIIGKRAEEIFPHQPELLAGLHADERKVIESGEIVQRERRAVAPDGSARTYIATKFPVFDADGKVANIGTVSSDITVRRAAEEQLRQAQKMEAVGQLTNGIAHDFNNLLAVIIGNAERILDRKEAHSEPIEAVVQAASRGAELAQRLLAFSRKQALQPKSFDLNAYVAGMNGLLSRSLGETISVEISGQDGLWPCEADPGLLESALLNLAINARDAMPGGGQLTIEASNMTFDEASAAAQPDVAAGD